MNVKKYTWYSLNRYYCEVKTKRRLDIIIKKVVGSTLRTVNFYKYSTWYSWNRYYCKEITFLMVNVHNKYKTWYSWIGTERLLLLLLLRASPRIPALHRTLCVDKGSSRLIVLPWLNSDLLSSGAWFPQQISETNTSPQTGRHLTAATVRAACRTTFWWDQHSLLFRNSRVWYSGRTFRQFSNNESYMNAVIKNIN